MYIAYVIQSENNNLYSGHTNNLERRLLEHNNKFCKSTKIDSHWVVVFTKSFPTRSEAMKHEKWLKTGHGREFLKSYIISNKKT